MKSLKDAKNKLTLKICLMETLKNACKIYKTVLIVVINGKKYIYSLKVLFKKLIKILNGISMLTQFLLRLKHLFKDVLNLEKFVKASSNSLEKEVTVKFHNLEDQKALK